MEKETTDPSMVPLAWCELLRLEAEVKARRMGEHEAASFTRVLLANDNERGHEAKCLKLLLHFGSRPDFAVLGFKLSLGVGWDDEVRDRIAKASDAYVRKTANCGKWSLSANDSLSLMFNRKPPSNNGLDSVTRFAIGPAAIT